MRLLHLIKDLITEATVEQIYQKYYSDLPWAVFFRIVTADPKSILDGRQIKKAGKYSKVLIQMYKNGGLKLEDLPRATEYLSYVYKYNVPLDLKATLTLTDIYRKISQYLVEESGDFNKAKEALNPQDYETIFQGKKWDIYSPLTERAAAYLGIGTNWCTTWGEYCLNPEYKTQTNQFNSYHKRDKLYILVNKGDPTEKYQLHFQSKSFMNRNDNPINLKEFFSNNTEVIPVFYPSLYGDTPDEEFRKELNRIQYLPDTLKGKFIQRLIKDTDNPIVVAILQEKIGPVAHFFGLIEEDRLDDEQWDNSDYVEYTGIGVQVNLKKVGGAIQDLIYAYSYAFSDYGHEVDVSEHFYGTNIIEEQFQEDLEKYLKENESALKDKFGIHLEIPAADRKKLQEEYSEKFGNIFYDNATEAVRDAQRSLENQYEETVYASERGGYYGGKNSYELTFNKFTLIRYLAQNNITEAVKDLEDFVEDFMYAMDTPNHDSVYEDIRDAEFNAGYADYKQMKGVFESYFEDLETDPLFVELRKALQRFVDRYHLSDNYEYHKGDIMLKLYPEDIDADAESVRVWYINRATGVDEKGYVKIENLPRYITNYSLFEIFFGK